MSYFKAIMHQIRL